MTGGVVIVGAGLAGAKAAQTLREEGFDGRITLVGAESRRPYERPGLSKGFLTGNEDETSLYVHEEGWYAAHDVDLLLDRTVESLDPAAHQVRLLGGEALDYDTLLLATGAEPRRAGLAGENLDGVHHLRTLPDAEALRTALRGG